MFNVVGTLRAASERDKQCVRVSANSDYSDYSEYSEYSDYFVFSDYSDNITHYIINPHNP